MRWMWLLAVVAACRIGFDEHPLSSDGPVGDAAADASNRRDASSIDASLVPCVDATCTAAGGTCVLGACEITNMTEDPVTCADGMPCRVVCMGGFRPCRDGVSCAAATSCEIQCIGYRACQYGVDCVDSTCAVTCDGEEACEYGITVGSGGTCTSHCCGLEACEMGTGTCMNDAVCN